MGSRTPLFTLCTWSLPTQLLGDSLTPFGQEPLSLVHLSQFAPGAGGEGCNCGLQGHVPPPPVATDWRRLETGWAAAGGTLRAGVLPPFSASTCSGRGRGSAQRVAGAVPGWLWIPTSIPRGPGGLCWMDPHAPPQGHKQPTRKRHGGDRTGRVLLPPQAPRGAGQWGGGLSKSSPGSRRAAATGLSPSARLTRRSLSNSAWRRTEMRRPRKALLAGPSENQGAFSSREAKKQP